MFKLRHGVLAVVLGVSLTVKSAEALKDRLANEFDYISQVFSRFYAPKTWKESYLNWNFDQQYKSTQDKIQKSQSVFEYRQAVADFLNSVSDYHVGYAFYSTEKSKLPFTVRTFTDSNNNSKTLVIWIDRSLLPEDRFDLSVGDEILSLNGKPTKEILAQLKSLRGSNVAATDALLADMAFTSRSVRKNTPAEKGAVLVSFKKQSDQSISEMQIIWDYTPEMLPGQTLGHIQDTKTKSSFRFPQMVGTAHQGLEIAADPFGVGLRKSFLPNFGTRIWETGSDNPFDAYIFQNDDGKLIGVIRIPSYVPDDTDKAVDAFADIITKMQASTSALIIDQVNNPGGSVFYLYTLASMLTDKAITTPQHRMMLDSADVKECVDMLDGLKNVKDDDSAIKVMGKRIEGYPVSYQLAKMAQDFCQFSISQWQQGKYFTEPYFLWGVDRINPHPTARYKKPIMILTNQLDFSGGDFFPATMQDNKRAVIVGSRTAGAGGYVKSVEFPNSLGLATFSFTGSIAERANKNPIENLGVTPDVKIDMSEDDFFNGFQNYIKQVKKTVTDLAR